MRWNWVIVFTVVGSFFLLGFLVLLDQYMRIGIWIQWQDMFHHETFSLTFFAIGVGILVGSMFQAVLRAVEQR
jgi:hypothetical protein